MNAGDNVTLLASLIITGAVWLGFFIGRLYERVGGKDEREREIVG